MSRRNGCGAISPPPASPRSAADAGPLARAIRASGRCCSTARGVAIIASVTPAEADIIGRYMAAVGRFLESNDPAYLAPFAGEVITDTAGRHHPLETDPNALYRLEASGGETFEDVYRIVV